MKTTPFTFLRGAAAVMAADLAVTPVSGLMVQAAGDCHCLNFGGFATPERRLAFDINDFDETAVAPWEWDVKRLAASFVVATLDVLARQARTELAEIVARRYRESMAEIAGQPVLDTWYRALTIDDEATAGVDRRRPRVHCARPMSRARIPRKSSRSATAAAHPRIEDDPRMASITPTPPMPSPSAPPSRPCWWTMPSRSRPNAARFCSATPRRRGLQGGGRRRGRHAVRRAADGLGQQRGALPAVQGGDALGARGLCRTQPICPSRREGGARPAPAAGGGDILLGFATGPTGRHLYFANCATPRSGRSSRS